MRCDATTLHGCLEWQAATAPERLAATFLDADGEIVDRLTFGHWRERAARVAAGIASAFPTASRVMLIFEPGLDFQVALFACFLSGRIAVPAYPPDPARLERTLPRLRRMVADAGVDLIVGSGALVREARAVPGLDRLPLTRLDELEQPGHEFKNAAYDPSTVAMIQYTSGSTTQPRGVVLTHANIVANMGMMQQASSFDETRCVVSWLPVYHDMGLAVSIFLPVVCGCCCHQMSPVDVMRRPMRWLQAIDLYRATDTAVPAFALELTASRVTPQELHRLDLSRLETCLVGAEPVRYASVQRFIRLFGRAGLRSSAMYPGYGLAEAVLAVASPPWGHGTQALALDGDALTEGRVEPVTPSHSSASYIVSMGHPLEGLSIQIVDPITIEPLREDRVGEVWIAGPSVAKGYLGGDDEGVFGNTLEHHPGPWLRSGDLGFFHAGELYITGRLKDVLIVRGRNHYPQDIEATAEAADPALRRGGVIAFSVPAQEGERAVIVAETAENDGTRHRLTKPEVVAAVAAAHGLTAELVFIRPGTIDKTSSGKVARQACRKRYLDGALDPWDDTPASTSTSAIMEAILADIRAIRGTSVADVVDGGTRLDELALDSLAVMELAGRIETRTGVRLPVTSMIEGLTLDALVSLLSNDGAHHPGQAVADGRRSLSLSPATPQAPVFCVGGLGGAALYLRDLARACAPVPLVALQPPGLFTDEVPMGSVEELAGLFVDEVLRIQPGGSYVLAGHSFGGLVAMEMARQLFARGHDVAQLMLLDTVHMFAGQAIPDARVHDPHLVSEVRQVMHRVSTKAKPLLPEGASFDRLVAVYQRSFSAMLAYRPKSYAGKVTLFRACDPFPAMNLHPERRLKGHFDDPDRGWGTFFPNLDIVDVPGDHFSLVLGEHAAALAARMKAGASSAQAVFESGAASAVTTARILEIDDERVRFDPFHPWLVSHADAVFRQMRDHSPVYRDASGSYWVFRHADVSACLKDKRLSVDLRHASLRPRQVVALDGDGLKPSLVSGWIREQEALPLARLYNHTMILMDAPRHDAIRQAFAPALTSEAMAGWKPKIEARVQRLVAAMVRHASPDLIRDVALPLPVGVVVDLLDISESDGDLIRAWAHEVFVGLDPMLPAKRTAKVAKASEDLLAYVDHHLRRWHGRRGDSLMAHLAEMDASGVLSHDEVLANMVFLFVAAFETTMGGIGNAMAALFDHPAQWSLLRAEPERIEACVDEFLRYDSSVRAVPRATLEDIQIGGQRIPKGSTMVLCLASANRDPTVFTDPDTLDLHRNARRHVAFAHGAHYCIGASLARMEMAAALSALIRLDLRPVPGGCSWRDSRMFHGHDRFEVRVIS